MSALAELANAGPVLLFGLAANTDNLAVGLAYGLKRRRIGWGQNGLIAAITTFVTALALAAGQQVGALMPAGLPNTVGGALLIVLAGWSYRRERRRDDPGGGAPRHAGMPVRSGESFLLACALSVNNIGLAIGGGIAGVGLAPAAASVFCLSLLTLALGQLAGADFARLGWVQDVLRSPAVGNGVLALAGLVMLAGF